MPPLLTMPIKMMFLVMMLKLMIMALTLMAAGDYGDDVEGTMGTDDHRRLEGEQCYPRSPSSPETYKVRPLAFLDYEKMGDSEAPVEVCGVSFH